MQMAVVEYARHVCGLEDAYSSEFRKDPQNPVIDLMKAKSRSKRKAVPCVSAPIPARFSKVRLPAAFTEKKVLPNGIAIAMNSITITGRFLPKKGMKIAGIYEDEDLVEMIEIPGHPWFIGCQFHPEFRSRPMVPHPLFESFVGACLKNRENKEDDI